MIGVKVVDEATPSMPTGFASCPATNKPVIVIRSAEMKAGAPASRIGSGNTLHGKNPQRTHVHP